MKIRDEIYESQATQEERESLREFRERSADDEQHELERQKN